MRVNLWEALHKIYTWPVSFDFLMQTQSVLLQSLNNASSQGKTWIMLLASEDVNYGA